VYPKFQKQVTVAPVKEEAVPTDLVKMLYAVEKIDTSHLSDEAKVKYMVKGTIPLHDLIRNNKEFLHRLPDNYRTAFYEVYYSIMGKHGHYNVRRMLREFRNLREGINTIVQYKPK